MFPRGPSATVRAHPPSSNRVGVSISLIVPRSHCCISVFPADQFLLIITHLHLTPLLVHRRILAITVFPRPLNTLRTRRILRARRRRKTRRRNPTRRRGTSCNTRRRCETRWCRKRVVRRLCLLLRLTGLERRIVLASHFGEGVRFLFGVADFLPRSSTLVRDAFNTKKFSSFRDLTYHFPAIKLKALTRSHGARRGVHVSE